MNKGTIGDRIRQIRKEERLTQEEFGARIGVKGNTVTGYERGNRRPSDSVVNYICHIFGINQTWLRTGEGEKDVPVSASQTVLEQLFDEFNCNAFEKSVLRAYSSSNERERNAFVGKLKLMFPEAMEVLSGGDPLAQTWQEAEPVVHPNAELESEEELHAELDRQLAAEKEAAAK